MKFYPLQSENADVTGLSSDYKEAHQIGVVRLGNENLFVKKSLKVYYIAYREIERAFRRVKSVNARLGCCNGDIEIDHLVLKNGDTELCEVSLPGAKAGRALLDELHTLAPNVLIGKE